MWYINIICIYSLVNLFSVYKREKYNVPIETFYMFLLISANLDETLSTMDPWGEAPGGGRASEEGVLLGAPVSSRPL